MTSRSVAAALFFLATVPACAGIAAGAVYLGDRVLGDSVPYACGKRGLVVGLMGIWGTVLFGFLVGQVDWVADRIAGSERVHRVADCGAVATDSSHRSR